jgi:hypothetical protein
MPRNLFWALAVSLALSKISAAAPYQLTQDWPPGPQNVVIDLATRSLVPSDNPAYQAWLAVGNVIQPPVPLTADQELAKRLALTGITITSNSTPSLNGTYRIDAFAQQRIIAIYVGIKGGDGLPGNGATFSYLDAAGSPRSFTADQFTAFAKAVRDYVYALNMAAMQPSPVWPSASVAVP